MPVLGIGSVPISASAALIGRASRAALNTLGAQCLELSTEVERTEILPTQIAQDDTEPTGRPQAAVRLHGEAVETLTELPAGVGFNKVHQGKAAVGGEPSAVGGLKNIAKGLAEGFAVQRGADRIGGWARGAAGGNEPTEIHGPRPESLCQDEHGLDTLGIVVRKRALQGKGDLMFPQEDGSPTGCMEGAGAANLVMTGLVPTVEAELHRGSVMVQQFCSPLVEQRSVGKDAEVAAWHKLFGQVQEVFEPGEEQGFTARQSDMGSSGEEGIQFGKLEQDRAPLFRPEFLDSARRAVAKITVAAAQIAAPGWFALQGKDTLVFRCGGDKAALNPVQELRPPVRLRDVHGGHHFQE